MGDEVLSPSLSFLSSMAQRALYQINAMRHKVISKKIWLSRDSLIHQKASNVVNSLLLTYAASVNVWDNIASL